MNPHPCDAHAPWLTPAPPDQTDAWRSQADRLANWAWGTMVIRTDAWGRYLSKLEMKFRDDGARQITAYGTLTRDILQRHFMGARREHLCGPLVYRCEIEKNEDGTEDEWAWCQMLALDIDNHSELDEQALPLVNHRYAHKLYQRLLTAGNKWRMPSHGPFTPLFTDSNGAGGFHLRMFFHRPVMSAMALAFGKWLISDHERHGVQRPEVFPKQALPTGRRVGSWLRLPGKHHTRDHWTRVWDGERWLAGQAAVSYILEDAPARSFEPAIPDPHAAGAMLSRFTTGFSLPGFCDQIFEQEARLSWGMPIPKRAKSQVADEQFNMALLRDAMNFYSCENLQNPEIFKVGAALKSLGDDGFVIWMEWLLKPKAPYWMRSEHSYTEEYWENCWRRFSGDCTLGSIYYLATEAGWDRAARARIVGRRLRQQANAHKRADTERHAGVDKWLADTQEEPDKPVRPV